MVMDNPHGKRPEHLRFGGRDLEMFEGVEFNLIRPWCRLCNPGPSPRQTFTAGEVRSAAFIGLILGAAVIMFIDQWWK